MCQSGLLHLWCLSTSRRGKPGVKQSPRDSSVPRDKCFLSNRPKATETPPVPNSNNLKRKRNNKKDPSRVAWNCACVCQWPSHALAVFLPSGGPVTNSRTSAADPGGPAQSGAVAVEPGGTRPAPGAVLDSGQAAPGSRWAGELLGERGAAWTHVARRTHAPGGCGYLWERISGSADQQLARFPRTYRSEVSVEEFFLWAV